MHMCACGNQKVLEPLELEFQLPGWKSCGTSLAASPLR